MEESQIKVCRISEYKKGYTYGPHSHTRMEINFIISGKAFIRIKDDVIGFSNGECMLIYPETEHYFEVEQKVKLLQIEFQEEAFSSLEKQIHALPDPFLSTLPGNESGYSKIDHAHLIHRSMERIYEEVQTKRVYSIELLSIYFKELLLLLKRRLEEKSKETGKAALSPLTRKAVDFIRKNYSEQFSIETLAADLVVSSRHLRQLFKNELNTNICSFILDYRLMKARELLKTNRHNISEVAYLTGFNTPQYFSKKFTQGTGMTPTEYVEQYFRFV